MKDWEDCNVGTHESIQDIPVERSAADQRALVLSLEAVQRDGLRVLFGAASQQLRETLGMRTMEHGSESYFATSTTPGFQFNKVMGLGLDGPITSARLDVAADWLRRYCPPGSLLMLPPFDGSPTLARDLAQSGFERFDIDAAVFHLPAHAAVEPPSTPGISVRKVTPAETGLFGEVICEGLEKPSQCAAWPAAYAAGQPGMTAYLAYDGETAIGAAVLFVRGTRAWLGSATTIRAFRGRGAQSALLAQRIVDGRKQGATVFSVETLRPTPDKADIFSPYRNVRRMGFELAYFRPNYVLRS
jgi:hypothetical protein